MATSNTGLFQANADPFSQNASGQPMPLDPFGLGIITTPNSPYSMQPDRPTYIDTNSGKDIANIRPNTQGLTQFRMEALRQGPSRWANLANTQQDYEQTNARNQGARSVAGQNAQAEGALAMRGGLTSGARERIATEGAKNMVSMGQNIANQGSQNRLQIGLNDEQNRIQELGMLPGMENQAIQPTVQRAGLELQQEQLKNAYNANVYNQQMQAWGAGKTADAMSRSGGSCWLISALCANVSGFKLPSDQAKLLTRFKHYMLSADKKATQFYIRRCGKLIDQMKANSYDWNGLTWFNSALVTLLRAGELGAAFSLFQTVLCGLIDENWSDCKHVEFQKMMEHRSTMKAWSENVSPPELSKEDAPLAAECLQNLDATCFEGARC